MLADIRATGIVRAGNGKTLTLSSGNNSALNAGFSLWGGGERPTVIELSDDQGWHLYSQRRPDGGIELSVNGNIYPGNYSNFDARYVQNIQRGAPVWPGKVDEYGPNEAPAGCFYTGKTRSYHRLWCHIRVQAIADVYQRCVANH